MDTQTVPANSHGSALENSTPNGKPASKWLTSINDNNVYAPSRHVKAEVLKEQAGVPVNHVLVRDHGSEHDIAFADADVLDLADGNVFFTLPRCDYQPKGGRAAPAKCAFFVDDRPAITLRADQTGHTVRALFGLSDDVQLFRDYLSPLDEPIAPDVIVHFAAGPVFYSRKAEKPDTEKETQIIVNGQPKSVCGETISYAQVVRLAFDPVDPKAIYTVTYKRGDDRKPQGSMVEGDVVKIKCGEIFNVADSSKS